MITWHRFYLDSQTENMYSNWILISSRDININASSETYNITGVDWGQPLSRIWYEIHRCYLFHDILKSQPCVKIGDIIGTQGFFTAKKVAFLQNCRNPNKVCSTINFTRPAELESICPGWGGGFWLKTTALFSVFNIRRVAYTL